MSSSLVDWSEPTNTFGSSRVDAVAYVVWPADCLGNSRDQERTAVRRERFTLQHATRTARGVFSADRMHGQAREFAFSVSRVPAVEGLVDRLRTACPRTQILTRVPVVTCDLSLWRARPLVGRRRMFVMSTARKATESGAVHARWLTEDWSRDRERPQRSAA